MRRLGAPRKIGQVPLAGMDDEKAAFPRGRKHGGHRLHNARKLRNVIAERFAETARLEKVALHIDDDKRRSCEIEFDRRGLRPENAFPEMACFAHEVFRLSKTVLVATAREQAPCQRLHMA
jgi:hypothetical protein